jgi:tetratricopeptide (TPR) repeat protein
MTVSCKPFVIMCFAFSGLSCSQSNASQAEPDGSSVAFSSAEDCHELRMRDPEVALTAAQDLVDRTGSLDAFLCLQRVFEDLGDDAGVRETVSRGLDASYNQPYTDASYYWSVVLFPLAREARYDFGLFVSDRILADPRLEEPEREDTLVQRGIYLTGLGRFEEARRDLEEARQIDPEDVDTLLALADLFWVSGNSERALEHLQVAMDLDPEDGSIALRAGDMAWWMQADETARSAWGRALELEPESDVGAAAAARLRGTAPPPLDDSPPSPDRNRSS